MLAFEEERFDAVVCVDVLQARQVDPQRCIAGFPVPLEKGLRAD